MDSISDAKPNVQIKAFDSSSRYLDRVGTSIVQPVNSRGKCRKLPARQILQKSLRWQILAFMNKLS